MKKATEGITLIALIITILVLLILTGVTIATLTGENGIINKATAVQAEMTIAEEKEAISLSYAAAIMETLGQDVTADDLRVQLRTNGYDASKVTVTEEGENAKVVFAKSGNSYTVTPKGVITGPLTGSNPGVTPPASGTTPDYEKTPLPSTASTKPYYPGEEFEQVTGTNLENGLVVTDGTNYWTWVEVPRTIYTTTYNTIEYYTYDGSSAANLEPNSLGLYTEAECIEIEKALMAYTTTLVSRNGYKDEWYDGCGIASATEYNELKRKMLSSVYTNGGFWIGQYEMGASTYTFEQSWSGSGSGSGSGENLNTARTPICQKGAYPYNNVTVSEAQQLSTNINSGDRTSSLLFGIQWDLTLKHLQNKGVSESALTAESSTWGNYENSEFKIDNGMYLYVNQNQEYVGYKDYTEIPTGNVDIEYYSFPNGIKSNGKDILLTTGASVINSKMNIYDLAGNLGEMTLESATNSMFSQHVVRGSFCYYGGYNSVDSRTWDNTPDSVNYIGFRATLY